MSSNDDLKKSGSINLFNSLNKINLALTKQYPLRSGQFLAVIMTRKQVTVDVQGHAMVK